MRSLACQVSAVCEWGTWRTIGACQAPAPVCIKDGGDICKTIANAVEGA